MSESSGQISRARWRLPHLSVWTAGAVVIAALALLPILSVLWLALFPTENVWPHLLRTVLPVYLGNTLVLMFGVGALTAAVGTGAAWLVVMYDFPGRRWLQWVLLLPLAVPAYVGAYALVDFLEYAGPVQTGLREVFGWQTSRDYWFPQVRSMGGAIVVLGAALYPYVYILARAAFREQSAAGHDVAKALGLGPFERFRRVGMPLARPAIAAGVAVVMMESINDFGTVDFFAVQTLTTGIFGLWNQAYNLGGAAQVSSLALFLIVFLVLLEKGSRMRSRFFGAARSPRRPEAEPLSGKAAWAATLACLIPFLMGFVLPVGVLLGHALDASEWVKPGLFEAISNTVIVSAIAAVLTVAGGIFMVYGVRLSGRRLPLLLMPVTAIGYAAPGMVLAVGFLFPLAAFDNALADAVLAVTGTDPGLILTGGMGALVLAYFVRFFAIAQGTADAALGRIAPSLPMAARSLGRTPGQTLRAVHLPLVRASALSALLLVFVDVVKELPATLMLRPFGYDSLATRVYEIASTENLAGAAPAALMITGVGLAAVAFLAHANR